MTDANKPSQKVSHVHRLEIGDNAFWLATWIIIAFTIVKIVVAFVQASVNEDELVAKSPNPVATKCALASRTTVSQQCMALLAQKREN